MSTPTLDTCLETDTEDSPVCPFCDREMFADPLGNTACPCQDDAEADEMQEDDIQTDDGCTFYQYGKVILDAEDLNAKETDAALRAHMAETNFWPNVWYISDHGNVFPWTWETAE